MEASAFSSTSTSKPADDRLDDVDARVSGVTRPREVNFTKQTTAYRDRDTNVWKYRDSARVSERNGKTRNSGDGGDQSPRCAESGLVPSVEKNPGIVVRSGYHDGSRAQRALSHSAVTARHSPAGNSSKDRKAECFDSDGELSASASEAETATVPVHYLDCRDTDVSDYFPGETEGHFTRTEDNCGTFCADGDIAAKTISQNDTAELAARGLEPSSGGSTRFVPEPFPAAERDEVHFSPPSDKSRDSGEYLAVPSSQFGEHVPASVSSGGCQGSIVPPQFRLLESRRGSSVTFILPAHVSSGENTTPSSSSRQSINTEEGAQLQERYYSLSSRRMSAPELPPIADRERHRPRSRSTSKSSLNQLTAAVNSKNFYTRLTNGAGLHRNHSDSSLKALLSTSQGPTQSSASVSSFPSGGGGLGGGGGGGGTPGPGDYGLGPAQLHRSSSRALSWCATDNSAGSIPKLETLFEQKVSNNLVSGSFAAPGTPPHVLENHHHNNDDNNNHRNKSISPQSNHKIPSRSASVNGLRRPEVQDLAKMKGRKKGLHSECGTGEMETLATIEQFGRLKVSGMRRSLSDNKLVDKKNVRNARLNSSRHLSVNRTDRLVHQRRSPGYGGTSTVSGTRGGMRRVSSVSAINTLTANSRNRLDSNQDSEHVEGGGSEDSEEEEERRWRIREWLQGLDCADAPPEPVIDYADDPPQTDTALHIVYKEGR